MQRYYFLLVILTGLLAGCAPQGAAQPAEVRALADVTPTSSPEKSSALAEEVEVVPHTPPTSCPVTVPQEPPFIAPVPYSPNSPFESNFWYGSNSLWTDLPKDGIWYGLPDNSNGYTQKIFWWREGYIWNEEPQPDLTVTGERLDSSAPSLIVSRATNAFASDIGSAMLVGVDFPILGCWKITGKYADAELSFVVWVAP
jgi:hypothetical protein